MRLQKFLAQAGLGSRRKCEGLIRAGRIRVNGAAAAIAKDIDPAQDTITCDGASVTPSSSRFYYLLNKPKGLLSTVTDPGNRATVLHLVSAPGRVYPVGRLDKDSEGLMLLTNDGEMAYLLTHPKFEIEKVYEVIVFGIPPQAAQDKIARGLWLEDGMTAPCKVRTLAVFKGKNSAKLEIKIHEGKKREIRRMLHAVGFPVISLCRTSMGPLKLGNLATGTFRPLKAAELDALLQLKAKKTDGNAHKKHPGEAVQRKHRRPSGHVP